MELYEIKNKVEEYYGLDISCKNRGKEYSDARRLFVFMARSMQFNGSSKKFIYQDIGDMINRGHDSCLYHYRIALQWFKSRDKEFNRDLFLIFGIESFEDRESLRLDRLRIAFDDILLSIPDGMHEEIMQTIKLKVKSTQWKHEDKCLVISGSDGISGSVF
tara:strand:+ start:357 stop:839 length:483 start_codon:yes stop_codon:yes gene_type:complete